MKYSIYNVAADAPIWSGDAYKKDLLLFNVLDKIKDDAFLRLSDNESFIICRNSEDFAVWVWTAPDITAETMKTAIECVKEYFEGKAPLFIAANITSALLGQALIDDGFILKYREPIICYSLDKLISPPKIGSIRRPGDSDIETVADFLGNFREECFHTRPKRGECLITAGKFIKNPYSMLYEFDGETVGCISARDVDGRHTVLTNVYILPNFRGRGAASSMTADMCRNIFSQGKKPTLYADGTNPVSNRVYRKIGFNVVGTVYETKMLSKEYKNESGKAGD